MRVAVSKSMIKMDGFGVENIAAYLARICVSNRPLYDTVVATMKRTAAIDKVALYGRVSTKDGRQDTENQLIALRDYCAKQGWEITGEYVDHESGGTSKRQHFQRLFADASRREFDLVL